ncbi:MAG: hypothetical protein AAFN38_15405 [Cyanobacteria bacterium J06560_5]
MLSALILATFSVWVWTSDDCAECEREEETKKALQQAIANVQISGSAHQFVTLGHIYQSVGRRGDALAVYYQALTRDANNVEALQGAAKLEVEGQNWAQAAELRRCVIALNTSNLNQSNLNQWCDSEAALVT